MDLSCRNSNDRRPEYQFDMPEGGQLGTFDSDVDHRPNPNSSKARKDNLPDA